MILDGKATAAAIRAALRENIAKDREKAGRAPCLAVVLVGEDPASQVYVRNKEKACADAGIDTASYRKPASILAKETISSMQGGLLYGQVGQTEYIIRRLKEESGYLDAKVVATGGLGKMIVAETDVVDVYDSQLTLKGLRIIFEKNRK